MDTVVLQVLARYPAVLVQGRLEPLGNRGGFSGARLWQLMTPAGILCLRAAAPGERGEHVAWRHRLMALARAGGLHFVPAVLHTAEGTTFVEAQGRCWEVMEWLPGRAEYRRQPSRPRLEASARALALIHDAWRPVCQEKTVCPAVLRRLELASSWQGPISLEIAAPLRPLLERLQAVLRVWMPQLPGLLEPWQSRSCLVQPCLRDVWHDHLLFEGERLTGLVDYAAMDVDSVATDLARMLGSLVADDDAGWQIAVAVYREVRALSAEEEELARVLDQAGTVLGLLRWLRWLSSDQRSLGEPGAALERVEELLRRVEGWRAASIRAITPRGSPIRG
jgi:homoserine kinase type II